MPVRQQKLEAFNLDGGSSENAFGNARSPFRESETMELKSLAPTVDHEGFSVRPAQAESHAAAAQDSDSDDDAHRSRLRSIRIRDASEAAPIATSDSVSVDFLNNTELRRSARDAWATPDGSAVSLKLGHNTFDADDWAADSHGSPKRVLRVIDVPLCERVVPPVVDAVMTTKIKSFLRADKLRIWLLPYSDERGDGHIPQELITKYAARLSAPLPRTEACIERLRILTFNRKVRRLAAEGITVAHIETEVVEPDRSRDVDPPAAADAGSAATAQSRKAYDEIAPESPYALANAVSLGEESTYEQPNSKAAAPAAAAPPVYAVANAVPTRRYEDLVDEYSDINFTPTAHPYEYASPSAVGVAVARQHDDDGEEGDGARAAAPPLPTTARPNGGPATVVEVPSPTHFVEPTQMQVRPLVQVRDPEGMYNDNLMEEAPPSPPASVVPEGLFGQLGRSAEVGYMSVTMDDAHPAAADGYMSLAPRPSEGGYMSLRPSAAYMTLDATAIPLDEASHAPLAQYNGFGNVSSLSGGYMDLSSNEGAALGIDQYALDLGPTDTLYTEGSAYVDNPPNFSDFNDLQSMPAPINAFDLPPPPPASSVAVSIPDSLPTPIVTNPPPVFTFDMPPPPDAAPASTSAAAAPAAAAPAPAPRARNQNVRASALEVNLAAGGDATCEGFVPQLFRPKICSLCFRERHLHKGS